MNVDKPESKYAHQTEMTNVQVTYKVYQKFQSELPFITQTHQNIQKVSIMVPRKSFTVTENGAPHQIVDRNDIQGNFASSHNPFKELSFQIQTSIKQLLVKKYTTLGHIPVLPIMELHHWEPSSVQNSCSL